MQHRLTIDQPHALGNAFSDAVRNVCTRGLTVTPAHLDLLDARLACGDFETVLALLREASRSGSQSRRSGRSPLADSQLALPLFLARYIRWTGDLHSAASMWNDVVAELEAVLESAAATPLARAICLELAPVATDVGDVQLAARLHGIARSLAQARPNSAGLPNRGMGEAAPDDVRLVLRIAFDTLGIEPDAAKGRLRLRPRLDGAAKSFFGMSASEPGTGVRVRNIRFSDGSVRFDAVRDDDALTIRVEQVAGSIPMTVLLEPFVAAPGAATVDGVSADLVPQSVEGGIILPVQLVLDDTRTLVIAKKKGRSPE